MKISDIFKFKLFEGADKANLKIVNENFDIVEQELSATNKEITEKVTEINNKITELNNLLGGKLDVSKIANNLVTTEAGYALDARMGKALSDGLNATKANTYNDGNLFNTGSFILGNRVCCGMFITPFGWNNYTVFGCTEPWREATSKCIIYNLSTQSMITPIADEDSFKATIPAGNLIIAFARFNI